MSKREVIFFFSQTSRKEVVSTDVKTWGALKALASGGISDKTCVLSGSKHVLALDDAELPEGKFTVFVYPKESKGGAGKPTKKGKKKVAKKTVKKVAKKAAKKSAPKKKKKSASKKSKTSLKAKEALGTVISSVEQKKINEEEALQNEAHDIGSQLRGYR